MSIASDVKTPSWKTLIRQRKDHHRVFLNRLVTTTQGLSLKDLNWFGKNTKFHIAELKGEPSARGPGSNVLNMFTQDSLRFREKILAVIEAEQARRKRTAFKRPRMGKTSRSKI